MVISYSRTQSATLNDDVKKHIFSFLPVRNDKMTQICIDLRKHFVFKKWRKYYLKQYREAAYEWLDNDLQRWCNDDIATLFALTPKFIHIMNRMCPKPYNTFTKFVFTKRKIQTLFNILTLKEVEDIDIFFDKINKIDDV